MRSACAYRLAVKDKRITPDRVPAIEMLRVENTREGFFDRAEIEALLPRFADANVRDFVEWGFRTGMRKGEIARLTYERPCSPRAAYSTTSAGAFGP
jgi:integrase